MPKPPALTDAQRREAYDRSLELRRNRAELKDSLTAWTGALGEAMFYAFGEVDAQQMQVLDLLTALPHIGERRALALLAKAGIPAKNTVRCCGPRQRERLFALL